MHRIDEILANHCNNCPFNPSLLSKECSSFCCLSNSFQVLSCALLLLSETIFKYQETFSGIKTLITCMSHVNTHMHSCILAVHRAAASLSEENINSVNMMM